MNKYKAIMQAERVHAILQSVSRGDTASSEEMNCLSQRKHCWSLFLQVNM